MTGLSERAPIFREVLGPAYDALPRAVRRFHETDGPALWKGCCDIEGPDAPFALIMSFIGGFPRQNRRDASAEVRVEPSGCGEVWTRRLGERTFRSRLSPSGPVMLERFGWITFEIDLRVDDGLHFDLRRARIGPVPLPRLLLPVSQTVETEDESGRFRFDVTVLTRSRRRVVRYAGWLEPAGEVACRPSS